jgi:hypothetical protein
VRPAGGRVRLAASVIIVLLALAARPAPAAADATQIIVTRLTSSIARCWFAKGEKAFAGLSYAPETDAFVGPPRILLVPKQSPHARPVLVIEIGRLAGQLHITIYGPLATSPKAPRIRSDIARWANGGMECS